MESQFSSQKENSEEPKSNNTKVEKETEKEMEEDPEFQREQITSGVVKNEIEPQNSDYDGPLFQWTPEEELKKDKLSNMIDFRALLANFDPASDPPLTSAYELDEHLESSASALFPAPYFSFLDFHSNTSPTIKIISTHFHSKTTTPTPNKYIKKEGRQKISIQSNEAGVPREVDLKQKYNCGPILLDSSVWEQEEVEEVEKELEQKGQVEELPEEETRNPQFEISTDKIDKSLPFSSTETEDPKSQLARVFQDMGLARAFENYSKVIRILSRALKIPNLTTFEKSCLRLKRSHATLQLINTNLNSGRPMDEVKVKGHLKTAREDAKKVALNQPDSWPAFYHLGNIYLFQNKLDKAKRSYENALKVLRAYDNEKKGYLENFWKILMGRHFCELESRFKAVSSEISKNEIVRCLRRVKITVNGKTEISSKLMDQILKRMKTHKNKRVVALQCIYRANSLKFKLESESSKEKWREIAELYAEGAERKNPEALYNFAMLHFEGRGVSKDEEKGTKLLKELALFSVDKDVEEEKCQFKDFEGLVQFPEPRKIFVAAAMYELGRRSKSEDEKESWFTKAMENGSALAANDLAILIKSRNGAHKKIDGVIQLFKTAADRGLNLGMRNLAWAYLQRFCAFDDKTDVQKAEYWFQKSLEEKVQDPDPKTDPDPEFLKEKTDFETCVKKLQVPAKTWEQKYDKFQVKSKSSSDSFANWSENCGENPENEKPIQTLLLDKYFAAKKEIEAQAASGLPGAQNFLDAMEHFTSSLNSLEKYVQLELQLQQSENSENDEDSPVSETLKIEVLHEFAQAFLLGVHLSYLTQEDKENLQRIASEVIDHVDPYSCPHNLFLVASAKIVLGLVQKGSLEGTREQITSLYTEADRREDEKLFLSLPLDCDCELNYGPRLYPVSYYVFEYDEDCETD